MFANLAGDRTDVIKQVVEQEENSRVAEEAERGKTGINSIKRRSTLITPAGDWIAVGAGHCLRLPPGSSRSQP